MMSMVAIAKPAPFTMQAMLPSREIYERSYLLASTSRGSSSSVSRRRENIFLAKECVAVEVHFSVEGQHLAVLGENQRIDLRQRSVALIKGAIEPLHGADEFAGELGGNPQGKSDAPALKRRQTDHRIDGLFEDFFRMFFGDVFDLDAALR